jgi:hypothetical protein
MSGLAWPLHRPVTVMMWWRLRAPMRAESGFHLVHLSGRGYIANFVRSGPWCALTEPTFALQVWRWPGIVNFNGIHFGSGWVEPEVWHHVALVVSAAATVSVYWDGVLRAEVRPKGRTFTPDDVVTSMRFGPQGKTLPMDVDELLILDVPLGAPAVRAYITAVRNLTAAGFPVVVPATRRGSSRHSKR